jgi:hypothetical protein
MDIGDENGYGRDIGILWAAYKAGSFDMPEMGQDEFANAVMDYLSGFDSVWVVEDKTKQFAAGRGPVAAVCVAVDGAVIQPKAHVFKWASKKNILRGVVAFLQMIRYSKDVGACVIFDSQRNAMLDRMKRYGLFLWHIGNGVYCLAGRKNSQ